MTRRAAIAALAITAACSSGVDDVGTSVPVSVVDPPGPSGDAVDVTLDVVDGDSLVDSSRTQYRLRGIDAPEPGECLAEEAADRLDALVGDGRVLVDYDGAQHDRFGRELVYVFGAGDRLLNEVLVREGLALAVHADTRGRFDTALFDAQADARVSLAGFWRPDRCGQGPLEHLVIVEIRADPPGPDGESLDDEYVVVANHGPHAVDLTGWSLRDESTRHRFRFPPGTTVRPDEELTVTSGRGPLGFGLETPIWNNGGDTAYLVDSQGRFVSSLAVEDHQVDS